MIRKGYIGGTGESIKIMPGNSISTCEGPHYLDLELTRTVPSPSNSPLKSYSHSTLGYENRVHGRRLGQRSRGIHIRISPFRPAQTNVTISQKVKSNPHSEGWPKGNAYFPNRTFPALSNATITQKVKSNSHSGSLAGRKCPRK